MKYTTSIIAGAAFALFLQPCPAPLIAAPIGALATGVLAGAGIGAGAAIGGAAAAKPSSRKRGIANALIARQYENDGSNSTWDIIQECTADMFMSPSIITEFPPGGMVVYNCPSSCMTAVEMYNSDPSVEQMNAQYGSISAQGSMITMSNLPGWLFQSSVATYEQNLASESGPVAALSSAGPTPESSAPGAPGSWVLHGHPHGPPRMARRYE